MARRMAQVAVFLLLAVLLWRAADGRAALTHLQQADPRLLLLAGGALVLQTGLSAERWRVTAAKLGLNIPRGAALREYYLAQVVNQTLPGGVIGDANRAVRSRSQAGLLIAAQAVLFERIAGQIGLIFLLMVGLATSFAIPGLIDWPLWLLSPLVAIIAAAGIGVALVWVTPGLRRVAANFGRTVWSPDVRLRQATLSLGTALCNVAAFAVCAVALDVAMPLVAVVTLVPLILFAMVLPISIGGWGVREGAAALLFPVIGATSAEGLATSIAFGLVFLATILPGVLFPLLRPNAPVRTGD